MKQTDSIKVKMHKGLRILQWIQRQGVIFYTDKKDRERAKFYLQYMQRVFPELISQLNAVYLYRQSEQICPEFDGVLWKDVTSDIGVLYAVGLSLEALQKGPEYTQFLFIHELCHIEVPGEHGKEFQDNMAKLLDRYNRLTGADLQDEPACLE